MVNLLREMVRHPSANIGDLSCIDDRERELLTALMGARNALLIGLNGVILLAYVVAIPANEIVIPTILMLTVLVTGIQGVGSGAGVMFELDSQVATARLLEAGGWTLLMAINLMLFSLIHNPCSTTIYTIWKETRSAKWCRPMTR